ncbi:MAG TPA: DUF3775 domain-containing protein [Stellaceae bacterium]|nr:DUF3775 domain-containing protein [Stellaceae bacterium]
MLSALTEEMARSIADAAAALARDERAMVRYLGIGRRGPPRLMPVAAADLGAFDTDERRHLRGLLESLSIDQRRELIALAWIGKSAALDFATALRRTRRVPPDGQVGYLMSRQLDRYVPAGLDRLRRR